MRCVAKPDRFSRGIIFLNTKDFERKSIGQSRNKQIAACLRLGFIMIITAFSFSLFGSLQNVEQSLYSLSPKEEMIPPHSLHWLLNFQEGLLQARDQDKPLLAVFVGLPWCPWSEKIQREVLEKNDFIEELKEQFILVFLNLPEEGGKHDDLRERFGIEELPLFLLLDPQGRLIAKVGYLPKPSSEFAAHIHKLYRSYSELKEVVEGDTLSSLSQEGLKSLYLKAKEGGFEGFKDKLSLAGLKDGAALFFLLEQYRHYAEKGQQGSKEALAVRKKILSCDPQNKQGGWRSLALLDFDALSKKRSKKKKHIQAALNPLIAYVKKYGKEDPENLWKMEMLIAQFLFGKNKAKEALLHAKSAFNHAPEGNKKEICDTISYLEGKLKKRT